jgi:predicted nuclease of predicted toxin-antitoxin system
MSLSLYMDVHVPRAITRTLSAAGVDVITAQEDGCAQMPDPDLLDRAGSLNRVLFTRDDDLLAEATRRQRVSIPFYGVIFAHQMRVNIGQCIHDLQILAECLSPAETFISVIYLPVR